MDERSQERFNEITSKQIEALTPNDILFLRARRPYLKPHQLEEYKEILEAKPPKETVKHAKEQKRK